MASVSLDQLLKNKEAANALVKSKQFSEAAEQYERIVVDLTDVEQSDEARNLHRACKLNLSLCKLQLNRPRDTITHCSDILREDGSNLKALYRRGLAFEKTNDLQRATKDLAAAAAISPSDAAVTQAHQRIKGLLDPSQQRSTQPAASSPSQPTPPPSMPAGMPGGLPANMNPEMARMAAQMVQSNPSLLKQAAARLNGMSDEQLQAVASAQGISVDQLKQAKTHASQVSVLQDDHIRTMASAVGTRAGQGPDSSGGASASGTGTGTGTGTETEGEGERGSASVSATAAAAAAVRSNQPSSSSSSAPSSATNSSATSASSVPEVSTQAANHRSAAQPTAASSASTLPSSSTPGGVPAGSSGASVEALRAMMGQMGGGSPGGVGAAGGQQPDMASMLNNPDMLKGAMDMMKGMDPDTLASMSQSMGMSLSREQAATMKQQMERLSPNQLAMLAKVQQKATTAWAWIKPAYNVLFGSVLRTTITVVIAAVAIAHWWSA